MKTKPLGHKNYGSVPHLPNSRMGPADKSCHEGQAKIATKKARDSNDEIIVQEKLDGSNVGIARKNGEIIPLSTPDTGPKRRLINNTMLLPIGCCGPKIGKGFTGF